jgi:hypothetical protein
MNTFEVLGVATATATFWVPAVMFFALTPVGNKARRMLLALATVSVVGAMVIGGSQGTFSDIRSFVNWLLAPDRFFVLATMILLLGLFYYREWTKPQFMVALGAAFTTGYFVSMLDPNFRSIVAKPDNVPITIMIYSVGLCLWLGMRQAAINDERTEKNEPLIEAGFDDRVLVWPDLVYTEMICMLICTVALNVWAIMLRAPLEQPANPVMIPNPSKAPWYFLGLQELLVYFDPWIAGVLLPGLIILGLCAIPFIDKNPKGNGYYTLNERPYAIGVFLVGFIIMWVVLIVLGTFLRGPNWNFFGPFEFWDAHRPAALVNVNVSELFWIHLLGQAMPDRGSHGEWYFLVREAPGIAILGFYFAVLPMMLGFPLKGLRLQLGFARYHLLMQLALWMALVPIKMVFRWTLNLKYIVAITEWFFNV